MFEFFYAIAPSRFWLIFVALTVLLLIALVSAPPLVPLIAAFLFAGTLAAWRHRRSLRMVFVLAPLGLLAACAGVPDLPDLNPPAQTDASILASAPAPTSSTTPAQQSTSATTGTTSSNAFLNDVFDARATYVSVFLVPAAHYRQLPPCGQPASPIMCSDPAIVQKLRTADNAAKRALDLAEAIARGTTTGNFDAALSQASSLVSVAENLLVQFNIH